MEEEINFFIRRKTFWKLALKGHNRSQKKEFNKLVMNDKFKHQRSKRKKRSVIKRYESRSGTNGPSQTN